MPERFDLRMEAYVGEEWRTISEEIEAGSQDTGRMRAIADNARVPVRLVETHEPEGSA